MSIPEQARKLPPLKAREAQLAAQDNKCFYCELTLGGYVFKDGRAIRLKLHWDHQIPYVFNQNNHQSNFVAACHICNGIKYSLVFRSVDEAKIYINEKREAKGYL